MIRILIPPIIAYVSCKNTKVVNEANNCLEIIAKTCGADRIINEMSSYLGEDSTDMKLGIINFCLLY